MNRYPFKVIDIIFTDLLFMRKPELPPIQEAFFAAQVKLFPVNDDGKLQVNLRIMTPKDSWLSVSIEAVALFDYLNEDDKGKEDLILEYVNSQGLLLVWAQLKYILRMITASMGINVVDLPFPESFELNKEEVFRKTTKGNPKEIIAE